MAPVAYRMISRVKSSIRIASHIMVDDVPDHITALDPIGLGQHIELLKCVLLNTDMDIRDHGFPIYGWSARLSCLHVVSFLSQVNGLCVTMQV